MQLISRRVNQGLVIGDDIVIRVLDVQDDAVRLGISDSRNDPPYWEQTLHCEPTEDTLELQFQYR